MQELVLVVITWHTLYHFQTACYSPAVLQYRGDILFMSA